MENLYKTFDHNQDGVVSYHEFLSTLIGMMNKMRYELVEKAFIKVDSHHYGEVSMPDLFAVFDGSRHPDVAMGKMSAEDANLEFRETFEMHHNTVHDYDSSAPVTKEEFLDFYGYLSSMTESDHVFDQLVTGPWNLDNRNNFDSLPYAGAAQTITDISAKDKWRMDHHKKMFTGNENDIIAPGSNYANFTSTHQSRFQEPVNEGQQTAGSSSWPAGSNPTWAGQLMDEGQRMAHLQQQYYEQETQYLAQQDAGPHQMARAAPQTINES